MSSKTPESEAPPYLPGLHLLFQPQFLLQDLQQLSLHCALGMCLCVWYVYTYAYSIILLVKKE